MTLPARADNTITLYGGEIKSNVASGNGGGINIPWEGFGTVRMYGGAIAGNSAKNGGGISETFTVRRISYGVGVERVFPLHSPNIEKIEVSRRGKVRRAKLYYLRDRVGKRAKVKEKI